MRDLTKDAELERKIRAAIRRDPHVLAICEMLGASVHEFLEGTSLDSDARELGAELVDSAIALKREAARDVLREDVVELEPVDRWARSTR